MIKITDYLFLAISNTMHAVNFILYACNYIGKPGVISGSLLAVFFAWIPEILSLFVVPEDEDDSGEL